MKFKAEVIVKLKHGVKDPQGIAAENIIKRTGLDANAKVKAGKYYEVFVEDENEENAKEKLMKICNDILSNPVLEKFEIERFEKQ